MTEINSRIPQGPLAEKWKNYKAHQKLVNPANKRRLDIIVVGTGLAGASAAASLAEMGFNVLNFCIQDSPRRAHSIAAQGGINAAKNYQNDGDSVYRLFYDTIKGGDYRSREANVYRLAEVSNNIIDQCVAQGVPFAREYGGLLDNRSFGGAQVSRTFYARGQTGQQLLLGAYSALSRQIGKGKVKMYTRHGIKSYLTVNTVIYGEDLPLMRTVIDAAKEAEVSAIIACDVAAMSYANSIGQEVHLSTQLNISNAEALKFYAQFADVVVLARELNLNQVSEIHKQIIEQQIKGPNGQLIRIEMFAHGNDDEQCEQNAILQWSGSLFDAKNITKRKPNCRKSSYHHSSQKCCKKQIDRCMQTFGCKRFVVQFMLPDK